jgi:hypothetical protein
MTIVGTPRRDAACQRIHEGVQMPLKRPSTAVLITLILLISASGALSAQTLEETVASAVAFCRGYPRLQVRGYTDIDYRTPQPAILKVAERCILGVLKSAEK